MKSEQRPENYPEAGLPLSVGRGSGGRLSWAVLSSGDREPSGFTAQGPQDSACALKGE